MIKKGGAVNKRPDEFNFFVYGVCTGIFGILLGALIARWTFGPLCGG